MPEHDSSAFISYSREDSEFALCLAQDLKSVGAHVWLDQMDISPGVPWDNAIEDALNAAPQMLLVLSPSSSRSNNVRNEISFALEAGKIIIPVLYQDCIVPLRLQRNQRIDFRADYARGLTLLLSYLHVKNPAPEVLERAANGDTQRRTAWEAREAEADKLRERQKQEEAPPLAQQDTDRASHEAEQRRLNEAAAQHAIDEANRKAEAARIAEEKRKSGEAAAAARVAAARLQEEQAQKEASVAPPPPRKPDPPKPPTQLTPQPVRLDYGKDKDPIKQKSQSGRIVVAVLAVALVVAIIVIVAISNSHSSNATIVQGDGGSTDSGIPPAAPPATTPSTVAPPVAPINRPTAPNTNAKQQFAISQALGKQGNWVGASRAGELALSLDPQSEDILQYLSFIDHDQLFKFERAYELDQMRLPLGYGQDDFVEANLTAGRFDSCANLAAEAWKNDTDSRLKIVMSALQFVCMNGEHNLLANDVAGSRLRKEIVGLKSVGWTFSGTQHFVQTNDAFTPYGPTWVNLFQALTNGDEQAAAAALATFGILH